MLAHLMAASVALLGTEPRRPGLFQVRDEIVRAGRRPAVHRDVRLSFRTSLHPKLASRFPPVAARAPRPRPASPPTPTTPTPTAPPGTCFLAY